MRVIVTTDAATYPKNPGRKTAGFILQKPRGRAVKRGPIEIGMGTINEAELEAFALALEHLRPKPGDEVVWRSDSKVALCQVCEGYHHHKCKRPQENFIPFYSRILDRLENVKLTKMHIPGVENPAHALT